MSIPPSTSNRYSKAACARRHSSLSAYPSPATDADSTLRLVPVPVRAFVQSRRESTSASDYSSSPTGRVSSCHRSSESSTPDRHRLRVGDSTQSDRSDQSRREGTVRRRRRPRESWQGVALSDPIGRPASLESQDERFLSSAHHADGVNAPNKTRAKRASADRSSSSASVMPQARRTSPLVRALDFRGGVRNSLFGDSWWQLAHTTARSLMSMMLAPAHSVEAGDVLVRIPIRAEPFARE